MGETSTVKTDEAAPTQTNEATMAKAGEADERGVPVVTKRATMKAALTSPQLENQLGSRRG
jgi:hypothetical protein